MSAIRSKSLQTYIKEFNSYFQIYLKQKTESTENMLNRSLSLLCDFQNLDVFNPDTVDNCQFYINCYTLVNSSDVKSGTLWMCISILHQASKNLRARDAIVGQFRFLPLLSKVLTKIVANDKIHRVLAFLQDLTYGIRITWEEPYLSDLIQILVDFIYGEEESRSILSLSVLVNICYKNPSCIYLLLRTVRTTTFTCKIKSFGILAHKMLIILDYCTDVPNVSDLQNFIKKSFNEIENCMQSWNVPHLRHIVEFIINSNDDDRLHRALKEYSNFSGDMENLIKSLEARLGMDDDLCHGDENIKNQQICFGLIFELFDYILELTKLDNLLSSITYTVFNVMVNWIESEFAGAKALNVIRTIVKIADKGEILKMTSKFEEILPNLIENLESHNNSHERTTALLKLLITLLKQSQTEGLILLALKVSYFDKIFSPLTSISPETLSFAKFSEDDLAKYLFSLIILIEFNNICKSGWNEQLLKLFKSKQIHFIIAKGLLSGNEELCAVVFEISKTHEFPCTEVSKIVKQLTPLMSARQCAPTPLDAVKSFQQPVEISRMYISKTLEERLDKLITHIFEASRNSEFDNVATCELIEMFNYKINLFNNSEKNLEKRLEDASSEITNLSHRLSLQSNEMAKFYSINFKLNLTQERLQSQNCDLIKQLDTLKKVTSELSKKTEIEKEKIHDLSRVLKVKKAKEEELYAELDRYKKQEAQNLAELKHLQTTNKEYAARIENFKTTILRFEETLKEKKRTLEESEKELSKSLKTIEELKESNVKSENLIKHLEAQIAEKNEEIRGYEAELSETEEMRKTILNLMENKKPKRKA